MDMLGTQVLPGVKYLHGSGQQLPVRLVFGDRDGRGVNGRSRSLLRPDLL